MKDYWSRKREPLETVVRGCKELALKELKSRGITDKITVKIKDFKKKGYENWIALYRAHSQFTSRPIVWINKGLYKFIDTEEKNTGGRINEYSVITDNILHEYGHIIAEWAKKRNKEMDNIIRRVWYNEEDFAEGFVAYARDSVFADNENAYDRVIKLYVRDMK